MKKFDEVLRSMTFEFFGSGGHKIQSSMFLTDENTVFLDVRSQEEYDTISFNLIHHMPVLHIPVCEIPDRIAEIPRDKNIGIFCSSGVRASMVYFYLRALGFEKAKVIDGGYSELINEFKPGKLLKHISGKR
ncbi:MAG: sulfurtransferase [Candidatus Cloacimonas sp. 4484_275]|nr:MAG: sulfurtransferase [Candidatus Cloacimonas sp. 4484_275]